eukprot:910836-Pyramimonas_sp.AAC.1
MARRPTHAVPRCATPRAEPLRLGDEAAHGREDRQGRLPRHEEESAGTACITCWAETFGGANNARAAGIRRQALRGAGETVPFARSTT